MKPFKRIATFAVLGTATFLGALAFKQSNGLSDLEKSRSADLASAMRQAGTKDLDKAGFTVVGQNGHFKTDEYLTVYSDKPLKGFEPVAMVGWHGESLGYEMNISRVAYDKARNDFTPPTQAVNTLTLK